MTNYKTLTSKIHGYKLSRKKTLTDKINAFKKQKMNRRKQRQTTNPKKNHIFSRIKKKQDYCPKHTPPN